MDELGLEEADHTFDSVIVIAIADYRLGPGLGLSFGLADAHILRSAGRNGGSGSRIVGEHAAPAPGHSARSQRRRRV